jgi:hypothetical protein
MALVNKRLTSLVNFLSWTCILLYLAECSTNDMDSAKYTWLNWRNVMTHVLIPPNISIQSQRNRLFECHDPIHTLAKSLPGIYGHHGISESLCFSVSWRASKEDRRLRRLRPPAAFPACRSRSCCSLGPPPTKSARFGPFPGRSGM